MRTWDPEETNILVRLVEEHGFRWKTIEELVPGRSSKECRNKWLRMVQGQKHASTGKGRNRCGVCNEIKQGHVCGISVARTPVAIDEQIRRRRAHARALAGGALAGGDSDLDVNATLETDVKCHDDQFLTTNALLSQKTSDGDDSSESDDDEGVTTPRSVPNTKHGNSGEFKRSNPTSGSATTSATASTTNTPKQHPIATADLLFDTFDLDDKSMLRTLHCNVGLPKCFAKLNSPSPTTADAHKITCDKIRATHQANIVRSFVGVLSE